jgi:hypothetical protein
VLASGGWAVTAEEAVKDADAVILSIPLNRIPGIAPLLATVPEGTVVIDTSNYYPMRDEKIAEIEDGKVESVGLRAARPPHRQGMERNRFGLLRAEGEAKRER